MTPNPQQQAVIECLSGPAMVMAVPGSGKTATVTERIKALVASGAEPKSILAITFTNKAADEMRKRVAEAVGDAASFMTLCTFHSLCARIIRANAPLVGLTIGYTILDEDDSERLLKSCIRRAGDFGNPGQPAIPKQYLNALKQYLEGLRNDCLTEAQALSEYSLQGKQKAIADEYLLQLKKNNAIDFTGLLSEALRLFNERPDIRDLYANRFVHISVDEVQDTNVAQYEMVKHLASKHKNVLVVGDLDQCVPVDEMVGLPGGKSKRLGEIVEGDLVASAAGKGSVAFSRVLKVIPRDYEGRLVRITTESGKSVRATPNHALFGMATMLKYLCKRMACLAFEELSGYYLCKTLGRHEGKAWVLGVFETDDEAMSCMSDHAFAYGIPVLGPAGPRGKETRKPGAEEGARRLMRKLGIDFDYPHFANPDPPMAYLAHMRSFLEMPAGQFHPGMGIAVWDGAHIVAETVSKVEDEKYSGEVRDLVVEETHNFVAGGVVCHNSIYGWRGACPENILRFEKDFPGCKVFRMETNYRSTPIILKHSQGLIDRNSLRKATVLRTDNPDGEKPRLLQARTDLDMANAIASDCARRISQGTVPEEIAVLYRTNYCSRVLEQAFRAAGVKCKVVNGTSFWDRKEVKAGMALLKLLCNGNDRMAFEKVVDSCCCGVGDKALEAVDEACRSGGIPVLEAAGKVDVKVSPSAKNLEPLLEAIRDHSSKSPGESVIGIAKATAFWGRMAEDSTTINDRCANLMEMARDVDEHCAKPGNTLAGYLQGLSLLTDSDQKSVKGAVKLMTMHSCKGLEFDCVYVSHCTADVLPHPRALDSDAGKPAQPAKEEERRLLYVSMTRARKFLSLCAFSLKGFGNRQESVAFSPFLEEAGVWDGSEPQGANREPRRNNYGNSRYGNSRYGNRKNCRFD